jgi:hypothetical protein
MPLGRLVVVILRVATTVILNDLVTVWGVGLVLSLTCTVKVKVPAAVGVPEMTPAFTDRPACGLAEKV